MNSQLKVSWRQVIFILMTETQTTEESKLGLGKLEVIIPAAISPPSQIVQQTTTIINGIFQVDLQWTARTLERKGNKHAKSTRAEVSSIRSTG